MIHVVVRMESPRELVESPFHLGARCVPRHVKQFVVSRRGNRAQKPVYFCQKACGIGSSFLSRCWRGSSLFSHGLTALLRVEGRKIRLLQSFDDRRPRHASKKAASELRAGPRASPTDTPTNYMMKPRVAKGRIRIAIMLQAGNIPGLDGAECYLDDKRRHQKRTSFRRQNVPPPGNTPRLGASTSRAAPHFR